MKSYKIFKQGNKSEISISKLFEDNNFDVIYGKDQYSFAVFYSPIDLMKFFKKENVIDKFAQKAVTQLIVTNQKFLFILNFLHEYDLRILNCEFDEMNIDFEDIFGETINYINIKEIIRTNNFNIKRMSFRRNSDNGLVYINKNGVVIFDDSYDFEINTLPKMIDSFNYGLVAYEAK